MTDSTREGRTIIRDEVRYGWEGQHDPHGSGLAVLANAVIALDATGHADMIPISAGYKRSPLGIGDTADNPIHYVLTHGWASAHDVAYWARVASRYCDLVPEGRRY